MRTQNARQFYALHEQAPVMSSFLIDQIAPRVRTLALRTTAAAYRPALPLHRLRAACGFRDDAPRAEHEKGYHYLFYKVASE